MKSSRKQTKKASSSKSKKKRKMRTPTKVIMQRKLAFTFTVIMLALLVMIGVAAVKASTHKDEYSKKVLSQMGYDSQTIPYQRGNITDRNGVVLATNEVNYILILDPSIITSDEAIAEPTINALVEIFGGESDTEGIFTKDALTQRIYADTEATYIRYKKGLTEEQREAFVSYQESVNNNMEVTDWIKGVWFETSYKRIYPYGSLACDIIGFSSSGGSVGNYGIEQYYNDQLIGTNGQMYGYLNQDSMTEINVIDPVDGYSVVSTIDAQLQRIIEENVQEFWDSIGAENVAVIAMDPNTAEILASVNYPNYDLNTPAAENFTYVVSDYVTEQEITSKNLTEEAADELAQSRALDALWKNYVTTTIYEPGSTMKPLTVAAALEEGLVTAGSTFTCRGYETVDGVDIECHVYPSSHGIINLKQAVVSSCNPALMQISFRMGSTLLSKYQEFWGFGAKTGVDLPYEDAGLLIDADSMSTIDAATNAFGQNLDVTIVQMAAAYCSVLNGGTYYQPHVVKQIVSSDGQIVENIEPTVVRETVSKYTADFLKDAMRDVLRTSSAWEDIEGHPVGGKTGTAEKYPRGNGKYVVSLASFEPYDDPELFIMVVIDEPDVPDQSTGGYTTRLANAIWRDVIEYRYGVDLDPEEEPETSESGEGDEAGEGTGEQTGESAEGENNGESQSNPEGETSEGGEESTEVPVVDWGETP